jgi:hypothetical protein
LRRGLVRFMRKVTNALLGLLDGNNTSDLSGCPPRPFTSDDGLKRCT